MTKEEMFKLGFRIAEAIYLKPGQVVKSEAEILAEMPEQPKVFTTMREVREHYFPKTNEVDKVLYGNRLTLDGIEDMLSSKDVIRLG